MLLVLLRPKESEQLVTPVEAARGCEGKVDEQCDAARLGESGAQLVSCRTLEL